MRLTPNLVINNFNSKKKHNIFHHKYSVSIFQSFHNYSHFQGNASKSREDAQQNEICKNSYC